MKTLELVRRQLMEGGRVRFLPSCFQACGGKETSANGRLEKRALAPSSSRSIRRTSTDRLG